MEVVVHNGEGGNVMGEMAEQRGIAPALRKARRLLEAATI